MIKINNLKNLNNENWIKNKQKDLKGKILHIQNNF